MNDARYLSQQNILKYICHQIYHVVAYFLLQPENLLVDSNGAGTGKLKLVDFGDARYIHNHFHVHTLVGSSEFCAPEIVNVKPVALATDIWYVEDMRMGIKMHCRKCRKCRKGVSERVSEWVSK